MSFHIGIIFALVGMQYVYYRHIILSRKPHQGVNNFAWLPHIVEILQQIGYSINYRHCGSVFPDYPFNDRQPLGNCSRAQRISLKVFIVPLRAPLHQGINTFCKCCRVSLVLLRIEIQYLCAIFNGFKLKVLAPHHACNENSTKKTLSVLTLRLYCLNVAPW